ncbi:MAG TPA: RNA-directed DNA polymerase [Candidatus Binataceae bacterium]|nr:RNA-directed DNA polymerase [Candidatus Binataceae bacterium]
MATKAQRACEPIDVSRADVLAKTFSRENVRFTLKRMASVRDKDNLIAHPLRAAVLIEFEEQLSEMISRLVIAGLWSPSASYLCFTNKRSGNYRELVFPSLIDSVVGRRAIDVLEPRITADDNERVFCGRSHASSTREPGDYANWFQTWLDFSAEIASAARGEHLAYVYDTDVADFFPAVDRIRAKQFLAQRTGAHGSLIDLIFYCLEAWLPRFNYMAMTGLPIEPNDVSRLVAHNYLKIVDAAFPDSDACRYLRYVDDSTIFVPGLKEAHEVKQRHHMSLRGVGLNPNAAKSEIMTVEEYQELRHREVNLRIDRLDKSKDERTFRALVSEWYRPHNVKKMNWDRVTKRLYGTAKRRNWLAMKRRVVMDLQRVPQITDTIVEYLLQLENSDEYLDAVMKLWNREQGNTERLIHIARYLCDASFSPEASKQIADFAVGRVIDDDGRPGAGYARAVLLLAVHKHGQRAHREKILRWASVDTLKDEQLRLHFLYVFICREELDETLQATLVSLISSDTDLLVRLCTRALSRQVKRAKKLLYRYVRIRGDYRTVEARVLPLVSALARSRNEGVQAWLEAMLEPRFKKKNRPVRDLVLQSILRTLHSEMVS